MAQNLRGTPSRRPRHGYGRAGAFATVALALAGAGATSCGMQNPVTTSTTSSTPGVITASPDSTRWTTPGKNQPYALVWKNGVMNLWTWGNPLVTCTPQSPTVVLQYDAVYRGVSPTVVLSSGTRINGTLVTWRSGNGTVVQGGTFTAVVGPTATTMTGLIVTTLAGPCGAVKDSTLINLVRH